jgi:hypothetical protein
MRYYVGISHSTKGWRSGYRQLYIASGSPPEVTRSTETILGSYDTLQEAKAALNAEIDAGWQCGCTAQIIFHEVQED